ncbi:hypothetical protein [Kitasatospora sp. A2-31]|uniref:hypothetical protein n=1 Tax=Kitasatospora sp. A2-31 TaxID=2916414 RepID=UPI001EEB8900|nr:hypothetical protein [Kitasatospora sp. A2-31]MCG6497635.1 hypothetical protein [Kitasatospora sp. A2-31]
MITEEQIAQADAEAAEAEQARAEAEAAYAAGPARTDLYRALGDTAMAASHATARARQLRAEQAQQVARLRERETVEKAAAKELAGTAKKLAASRDAAVQAVTDAEKAAARAMAALTEHDQLVRQAAGNLRARGLRLDDAEQIGGAMDGSLRLNGEVWQPVDGASLLAVVLRSVVATANPQHPLGRITPPAYGGAGAARGRDALLARARQGR